jgi:hypothetical protein
MACELTCIYCKQRLLIERPTPGQLIRCSSCARVVPVPWAPGTAKIAGVPRRSAAPAQPQLRQLVNLRVVSLTAAAALTVVGGLVAGAAWWTRPATAVALAPKLVPAAAPATRIEVEPRQLDQPLASAPDRHTLLAPPADEVPIEEPVADVKPEPAPEPVAVRVPPVQVVPCAVSEKLRVVRRQQRNDIDLNKQLLDMPQLRLDAPSARPTNRVAAFGRPVHTNEIMQMSSLVREWSGAGHVVPTMLNLRADLQGLPIRMGKDCQLDAQEARKMQELSRQMRELLSNASPVNATTDAAKFKTLLTAKDKNQGHYELGTVGAIPCLMQMLPPESPGIRAVLIEQLAAIPQPKSSEALAKLALFDLSDKVREQAIQSLAQRPRTEYRELLLSGLRYPWAPVADHAAEALVALEDKDAVPALRKLSDAVDPNVATYDSQHRAWMVPEVVRINHLSNCVMCHAPSHSTSDLVRGRMPSQNEPLPPLTQYYADTTGPFVRADITYLRQDFSVVQEVEKPGKWPQMQRFDFLVRQRPEKPEEAYHRVQRTAAGNYPQRQAVLYALRELSK